MKFKLIILSLFLAFSSLSFSQKEVRKELRAGNKEYKQEKYTDAEIAYRKALEADARSKEAAYNLGNALYKQQKFPEALEQYQAAAADEKDKIRLSEAFHNAGNAYLSEAIANKEKNPSGYGESLKKSIEAYKQSLKKNSKDDETRYNLALAQKLLKDSEQENQDQQKQDQKQDQQKQDQQDQKQDQQKQDQKQQQNQPPPQMSKENAQQILDAMMQNEKNTQDKVKEQQMKQQQRKRTEKEW